MTKTKFMENFDPETSKRERRKLSRKIYAAKLLHRSKQELEQGRCTMHSVFYNREPRLIAVRRTLWKMSRKTKAIYDDSGHIAATGKDLCDCLDETCPGCHFPCPRCQSHKCGHECRVNRKWMYDKIEIEGNDFSIKNVYSSK